MAGISKFDPYHTPAGNGRASGEFASEGGGVYRPGKDRAPKLTPVQEDEPDESDESERTPEELEALALSRQNVQAALQRVQALDPNWRPPDTLTGIDADGQPSVADQLANDQEIIAAAQARLDEISQTLHPSETLLDPQGLNEPLTDDDWAQITGALARIRYNGGKGLNPHDYDNFPHMETGASLPSSIEGYTTYYIRGAGKGPGARRIIIDKDTGNVYYTSNHYESFYRIQ